MLPYSKKGYGHKILSESMGISNLHQLVVYSSRTILSLCLTYYPYLRSL